MVIYMKILKRKEEIVMLLDKNMKELIKYLIGIEISRIRKLNIENRTHNFSNDMIGQNS